MSILHQPVLGLHPETVEISNSEIQTFKSCKRRWFLGNYLGLQPNEKSYVGPLPLGTRVHDSLEQYYLNGTNPVDAYNRLQRVDAELFRESPEGSMEDKIKKFNDESELGRIMLEGYLGWLDDENPDSGLRVVGAEKKLEYRLPAPYSRVVLIGKVDLEVQRLEDDTRATLDHKTAASFDDYHKYAHLSEQLMHYTMLARLNPDENGNRVDGGIYNLLKKVKRSSRANPPFYERIDVRFNSKMLESYWIRTMGTVRDIMNTRDALDNGADHRSVVYPTPTMDWKTGKSPFFQLYSLMDDGSNFEAYIEDNFYQGNPNQRYEIQEETL